MNINFNIYYGVNPGEYICLNIRQRNGVAIHKMNQAGGNWSFELRINDAERHIQIGSIKLTDRLNPETEYEITDEATKKYIENLSWISIPSNT